MKNSTIWIGDRNKPEDSGNHEFGKWCYSAGQHCEIAMGGRMCDCKYFKGLTKGVKEYSKHGEEQ